MKIVRDADKGEDEEHVAVTGVAVFTQHVQHLGGVLVSGHDTSVGTFSQKVEEAVGSMAVVPREGEEGELAVSAQLASTTLTWYQENSVINIQKQDGVSRLEKVLGAGLHLSAPTSHGCYPDTRGDTYRTARTRRKIINKPHRLLLYMSSIPLFTPSQRKRGPKRTYQEAPSSRPR